MKSWHIWRFANTSQNTAHSFILLHPPGPPCALTISSSRTLSIPPVCGGGSRDLGEPDGGVVVGILYCFINALQSFKCSGLEQYVETALTIALKAGITTLSAFSSALLPLGVINRTIASVAIITPLIKLFFIFI